MKVECLAFKHHTGANEHSAVTLLQATGNFKIISTVVLEEVVVLGFLLSLGVHAHSIAFTQPKSSIRMINICMDYVTNYYKNLSEQLQNKVDRLSYQIKMLNESANPLPDDLQSPWQTPYSNPYSPSQPYWEYPEPQPTRRPGRGIIPSIDDVYPPESPTNRRMPELGVLQSDAGAEKEKSAQEWMFDMLPKEIQEIIKEWNRSHEDPEKIKYFWEVWQIFWLNYRGAWGSPEDIHNDRDIMLKEFQKLWKKFQEQWLRAVPDKRPDFYDEIRKFFKVPRHFSPNNEDIA